MKRRNMPADFAEISVGKSLNQIISHYGCGASTAVRWRRELSGEIVAPPALELRPMPADFPQHAGKSAREIMAIYQCGHRKVSAWRKELGMDLSNSAIPLPADFLTVAPTMTWRELADHYGYSEFVIRRFVKLTGAKTRARIRDQRRTYPGASSMMGRAKPAPLVQHIDMSRAGRAADFLRQFGPVIRCKATGGFDPKGDHWRRGSTILSADEVIARAVRNGWRPDAWREIAA